MLRLKHIAAYFLLLVYSISFGHQIIPHHHHVISEIQAHDHEEVHDHCIAEAETHDHVAHENHFDEGLLDYIGCILGGHEHNPATECELIQVTQDQKNHKKGERKPIDQLVNVSSLTTEVCDVENGQNSFSPLFSSQKKIALNRAKRGPPQA